jgi:hypothetical protein
VRSQCIDEHSAYDTPLDGACQCRDHLLTTGVIGKDVEEQVDVICGRINVSRDAVERLVVLGKKVDSITVQGWEMAKVSDQPSRLRQVGWEIRLLACAQSPHADDFRPEHMG